MMMNLFSSHIPNTYSVRWGSNNNRNFYIVYNFTPYINLKLHMHACICYYGNIMKLSTWNTHGCLIIPLFFSPDITLQILTASLSTTWTLLVLMKSSLFYTMYPNFNCIRNTFIYYLLLNRFFLVNRLKKSMEKKDGSPPMAVHILCEPALNGFAKNSLHVLDIVRGVKEVDDNCVCCHVSNANNRVPWTG